MTNARGIGRLGLLAVGLGIGAAVAATPASADSATDPLAWLLGPDAAAATGVDDPTAPFNFAYSINGVNYDYGTATATSTVGSEAFAMGNFASANAGTVGSGSTGDFAWADGSYALASSGGNANSNYDSAIDVGNNVAPSSYPGAPDGAYSGAASLIGNDATGAGNGSHDLAIDFGNAGLSSATGFPGDGGNSGAFAGAGGLIGETGNGNNDFAYNVGNLNGFGLGPAAVDGNNNSASEFGNMTGTNLGSFAGNGDGNIASEVGNNSTASAGGTYGTDVLGNHDVAYVLDPFGTVGSNAFAGPGDSYLAGVNFVDGVTATATGSTMVDILPDMFGTSTTTAATDTSNLLTDFLSLF